MLRHWLILLLALLGLSLSGCAGAESRNVNSSSLCEVVITDSLLSYGGADTMRLGRMGSGEQLSTSLSLRNESRNPMVVLGCELTCGCIALRYDNKPVMPGNSMKIEVDFDSRGLYGWQMKLFRLRLHGTNSPLEIYVEAEVE